MKVVVTTLGNGDIYQLDVTPELTVLEFMHLIAKESNVPANRQILSFNGAPLTQPSATLASVGIKDDDLIILDSQKSNLGSSSSTAASSSTARNTDDKQRVDQLRVSLLNDPAAMAQLAQKNPALAKAARDDPAEFQRLISALEAERLSVQKKYLEDMVALEASDPFDVEAQKRIEEAIMQQQIEQNMQMAMEHNPEVFAKVSMLYVPIEVSKQPVKAFVDSGAQSTIMSPELAAKCGLSKLIDKRFAGIAMGVGTAKILGRIHNAHLKIGTQFLPCSFIVMENKGVDFLFGLDLLRRFQASIDLKQNCLLINGESIPFLPEHELPASARELSDADAEASSISKTSLPRLAAPTSSSTPGKVSFFESPENIKKIETLLQLGATKGEAIQALTATNGDVDAAANLLF